MVLPSPAFVGVMPVTQTSFASGLLGEPVNGLERDLGLVAPVRLDLLGLEAERQADLVDRLQLRLLGDLQAALLILQCETAAAPSSETRRSR